MGKEKHALRVGLGCWVGIIHDDQAGDGAAGVTEVETVSHPCSVLPSDKMPYMTPKRIRPISCVTSDPFCFMRNSAGSGVLMSRTLVTMLIHALLSLNDCHRPS